MDIEAAADEMATAGWPGFELRRYGGDWMATFFRNTPHTMCAINAIGRGETIMEAILNAKEKANAHHS